MNANTTITDSFFSRYGLADSLTDLATAQLGDYAADYDLDRLARLHLEAINRALAPLGVTVTAGGSAICEHGARPDDEDIQDALDGIFDDETVNSWIADCELS